MTVREALTLPVNSKIPSVICRINQREASYTVKSKEVHVYSISDLHHKFDDQLVLWSSPTSKRELEPGKTYKIQSSITDRGLNDISVSKYKSYPPRIECRENAIIVEINSNNNMDNQYVPLNDKKTLMSYYGKTYMEMRDKMLQVPDVTAEQAHEAAIDFVNWIPKSFFGEKQLP